MKTKPSFLRRAGSFVLSLVFLAAVLCPTAVFAEEGETSSAITISTVEEFLDFAEHCRVDAWSVGRTVTLTQDIDLFGTGFEGIASFSGTLKGNHHTISNLNLSKGDGSMGLVLYLERDGVVENLSVQGLVKSNDSANILGGVVGINAGTVTGCSFSGSVKAAGTAGGIVGLNGASGTVAVCSNSGDMTSQNTVGGIVGQNFGSVTDCSNLGNVNSDSSWVDSSAEEERPADALSSLIDGRDIGGIAGRNSGVIASCRSTGIVGYKRSGQNVGGIAGFTSGDIINCSNDGKVFGKRNVGGIAGHVEPFVQLEDSESIHAEVDTLHDLINTAVDDLDTLTTGIHTNMDELTGRVDSASDTAKALSDELVDVVNRNIDVVNDLSDRVDYVSRHLPAVFDQVDVALGNLKLVNDDLKRVKDDLDIEDKLEDTTYDPAAHERVALESSVGGVLTVDNRNPAEGVTVTVTAKPETGYVLSDLRGTTQAGGSVPLTKTAENEYTFPMPEENVVLRAAFVYGGRYVVTSTSGGRLTLEESNTQLRLRTAADSGYRFEKVTIGGQAVTMTADGDSFTATVNKADYPTPTNGTDVSVQGVFERTSGAYTLTVRSSTGGTAYAHLTEANEGDTVTLTVNTAENYKMSGLLLNGADCTLTPAGEKKYTFSMPAQDTVAEVLFAYQPNEETVVYTESTVGGTVRAIQIPGANDYRVLLEPADGFAVGDKDTNTALEIYNSGQDTPKSIVPVSELSNNSYTLDKNNYTAPIRVKVYFHEEQSESKTIPVSVSSSAGGRLAADKTSAKAGDTLRLAVENQPHYRLECLTANRQDITAEVSNNTCDYTVPDCSSLHLEAAFAPVTVTFETESGCGSAQYRVDGNEVELTVLPATGYRLDAITVTAAAGPLAVQKQNANSEVYRFSADFSGTAVCSFTFVSQNDKATVEDAKDRIENNVDEVADATDRASSIIEDIQDLLTDEFGQPKAPGDLSSAEADQLEQDVLDLMDALGDAAAASGQIAKDAGTIGQVLGPYVEEALDSLDEDLDAANKHIEGMANALQAASNETRSIVDYLNSLKKLKAVKFSEEFSKNGDKFFADVQAILDIMKKMNDTLNLDSDRLERDMRKINDQLDKVLGMILDRLDNLESMTQGEDIWEDCSVPTQTESEDATKATRLLQCSNQGTVEGNAAVGGIAGDVQAEIRELDKDEVSIGKKYHAAARVENCTNQGLVQVKKDSGGGIVGDLALGYVNRCVSGGGVFGADADYLGGIAGKSHGTLQSCGSLAQIEGSQYLGGIAGCADQVHDCLSMATIPVSANRVGAIAGADVPDDAEDETLYRLTLRERMTGNRYVSSSLHGLDGISYLGVAEPISYQEMIALEEVPSQFLHLQVLFVDEDNQIVQRTQLPYGASLEGLEYPQLNTDSSSYVEWDAPGTDTMEGGIVLRAGTTANVVILSSVQTEKGKSLALAEGIFTEEDTLEVSDAEAALPVGLPAGAEAACRTLRINSKNLTEDSVTRIRLLQTVSGTATVLALQDGDWVELPTQPIGQYLQAEMLGSEESFCIAVVPDGGKNWLYLIAGVAIAAAAIVALVLLLLVNHRKKRRTQRDEEAEEEADEEIETDEEE